ncbi:unnamed protein product [Musa acuminata subsp. malaccensis]|uniref:(wild Malaysian banana) hypothetical protein n=1 Tax=Musa acuminata subsp. malaccensis TaxID=214687 RepID=A0A8D6ZZ47_MUSAM|nr:unnamed protein product [Musa acuminata subsp. malaccensis]
MKNVAKCDTWCELQNPVNHRVFERKVAQGWIGLSYSKVGAASRFARCPPLVACSRN